MKTKYQRLNKEQKKKARLSYYQTSNGAFVKKKLNTSLFSAVLCEIFGVYLLAEAIIKDYSIWQYIYSICLIIFGIAFIIAYFIVLGQKVNKYVIKSKLKF